MVHANLEKRESLPEDAPTPLDKLHETLSD
jgi:hypothetical protein